MNDKPKLNPTDTLKGCAVLVGALILFGIVGAMIGGEDTGTDGKKTIASIGSEIQTVSRDNEFVNVDVALKETWDGDAAVSKASMIALDVLKRVQAGAPDAGGPGLKAVQMTFSVPTRTALGEEGRSDLINIQIGSEILQNAKPEKMTFFDIMEVATVQIPTRIGNEAATEYCADKAKFSKRFCARLAMGLL